ncbi:hypothetical protein LINPERPRIM_LOCUS29966, partial [Linum perenne]
QFPILASLLLADPLLPPPDCVATASEELHHLLLPPVDLLEAEGQNMLRFYTEDAPILKISLTLSDVTCFDVCIESLLIRRRERGLVDWRRRGMRCRGREGGLGIWVIGGDNEGRRRRRGGGGRRRRLDVVVMGLSGGGGGWREEGEERGGLG